MYIYIYIYTHIVITKLIYAIWMLQTRPGQTLCFLRRCRERLRKTKGACKLLQVSAEVTFHKGASHEGKSTKGTLAKGHLCAYPTIANCGHSHNSYSTLAAMHTPISVPSRTPISTMLGFALLCFAAR